MRTFVTIVLFINYIAALKNYVMENYILIELLIITLSI